MNRISILVLAVFAFLFACDEKDEFDAVKPIEAPAAKGPAEPLSEGVADSLPQGHPPAAEPPPQQAPPMVRYDSPGQYGKTGPLLWTAPANWQATKPASQMRLAEYVVQTEKGEPPTLTIFHFGPAGGGGVEANVSRWLGQFGDAAKRAKRGEKTVNGMKVHTVDASGTYNPGMAGGNQPPKANQRLLGAIVESEAGLFFFKLVGPKAGVDAIESDWNTFVSSFQKG